MCVGPSTHSACSLHHFHTRSSQGRKKSLSEEVRMNSGNAIMRESDAVPKIKQKQAFSTLNILRFASSLRQGLSSRPIQAHTIGSTPRICGSLAHDQ